MSEVLLERPEHEDVNVGQVKSQLTPRQYKRIAMKVVDVYRNESTVVREIA